MKGKEHGVAASLNREEKRLLAAVADELNVPYCLIMRRLIFHILDGKIEWTELFKKTNALASKGDNEKAGKVIARTYLSSDAYVAFANLAEEWGSTTSVVLRRLILLYTAGEIQRGEIWP